MCPCWGQVDIHLMGGRQPFLSVQFKGHMMETAMEALDHRGQPLGVGLCPCHRDALG
jgi:hypothetical protein